jgi:hypothetical protein
MPLQPPPVLPAFILAVAACTWSSNELLNRAGGVEHPFVNGSGDWALESSSTGAYQIAQATYNLLKNGTANADGSFTSGGIRYWIEQQFGTSGNWAVAVAA